MCSCAILPGLQVIFATATIAVASDPWCTEGDKSLLHAGERIGKLIRNAEKAKTPVMCVVGEKEASASQLSVRTYGEEGDKGVMALSEVITRIQDASKMRMPF